MVKELAPLIRAKAIWSRLLKEEAWARTARADQLQVVKPIIKPIKVRERPSLTAELIKTRITKEGITMNKLVPIFKTSSIQPPRKPPKRPIRTPKVVAMIPEIKPTYSEERSPLINKDI